MIRPSADKDDRMPPRRQTMHKLGTLGALILLACGLLPGCVASRGVQRATFGGLKTAGAGTVKVSRAIGRGSVWAGKKVAAGTKQVAQATAGAVRSVSSKPASNGLDLGPQVASDDETLVASKPAASDAENAAHTVAQVGDGKGKSRTRSRSAHPDDAIGPETDSESDTALAQADANANAEGERPGDVLLASNDAHDDLPTKMINDGDGIQHDLPTLDLDQMLAHGEARKASQAARASSSSKSRSTRTTASRTSQSTATR
jgi:hypothetical protein